jgi:hypothetical protein
MQFRCQYFANSLYFSLLAGNLGGEGLAQDCVLRQSFETHRLTRVATVGGYQYSLFFLSSQYWAAGEHE